MERFPRIRREALEKLAGPDWLCQKRLDNLDRLVEASIPTTLDELWRYSRIDELDLSSLVDPASFDSQAHVAPKTNEISTIEFNHLAQVQDPVAKISMVNGRLNQLWIDTDIYSKGLRVSVYGVTPASASLDNLSSTRENLDEITGCLGSIGQPLDIFDVLNLATLQDLLVISIPTSLELNRPILIEHLVLCPSGLGDQISISSPRTLVLAGDNSRSTIIQVISSPVWNVSHSKLLSIPQEEISVGDGARVDFVSIQDVGIEAWQIGRQSSRVGRDGRFTSFAIALGGHYARQRTDSKSLGLASESNLLAAYYARGTQMHDFRTLQDHISPRSTSHLYFKGALDDEAESVYSGLIRVQKGAVKSNAFQENRNLVLSSRAHCESVPNLDIQESDVRCSHASAVGPIDPQHRYYLESRGINPKEADQLIVEGFFDDILNRSECINPVRNLIRRKIAAKQNEPVALGALAPSGKQDL